MAAPGGPIEIVFSFDTTGSMYGCLEEVRAKLQETIERLFMDIPALKIALIAHGDYCDSAVYVTETVDFTNDVKKLCQFVKKVLPTGGGDYEECYELVLRQCRKNLSWSPGTQRVVVMIGDAIPHPKNDPQNKQKIDWVEEAKLLKKDLGARIYAIQAYNNESAAKSFWSKLAALTGGKHMKMDKFGFIVDIMMAICYREHGAEFFDVFESEIRARPEDNSGLYGVFDTLRSCEDSSASSDVETPKKPRGRKPKALKSSYMKVKKTVDFKKKKHSRSAKLSLKKATKVRSEADTIKYSLGKPFRELIPETKFALNTLDWSTWYVAMADKAVEGEDWKPRPGVEPSGMRKSVIFPETSCSAIYEFAVQPQEGARKYPVYYRTTNGFDMSSWDTYLLRNHRIKKQLDHVLKKGCKVYIRRAKLEQALRTEIGGQLIQSVTDLSKLLYDSYDYAWDTRSRCARRKVIKRGKMISAPSFPE